jgi:hypothetical protein
MIEGLLSPPHVRNHESYEDETDLSEAEAWLREEIGGFKNAVIMGVPSSENSIFADSVEEILMDETFQETDIYAHDSVGDELKYFSPDSIDYDRMPSRIADIEWIREEIPADEDVAVFSFDYNVRTGKEIDNRLEQDTFGQFALDFQDFKDFSVPNYVRGLLPGFESFEEEAQDPGKSFGYTTRDTGGSNAVVLNVPYSDNVSAYDGKMKSETLRHGLALLPYGQRMKDTGKKGLKQVMDSFEY